MKDFLEELIKYRISPNQFYVLYCIHENIEARFINVHLELRCLRLLDYLDRNNNITILGVEAVKGIESTFTSLSKPKKELDSYWINEYYEMWPKGKLPSGKFARVDKKNLENSFKWFFKTYNYSWDTILKATALYIDHYETKSWLYMRTSQYFIRKTENDRSIISELANYCDIIESGDSDSLDKNHFKDKVV
jgi:hypothetical protein